ncbi:MAG: type II toxin-antitoxin system RelE/ParE family toxin [Planctomycetaceae bacterium]|nr:type II toxin-antitoxin system RelE/ParE family toxin [Planctomycetaceae bacterium]
MPQTALVIYQESKGDAPLIDWLEKLPEKVRAKVDAKVELLAKFGHELRRPHADYLQDGIYELRIGFQKRNYRILYAFIGHQIALLTHAIVKESRVPPKEIDEAILCRTKWEAVPKTHSFEEKK